ncbi:cytoplasmic tyrosine-protein kinase BMX [Ceratobasidium sp. AG-Ba]|nr:cytoplasmic tyrosine-protein kinase BMX [Ceratobasidium sp. AG-Ba]
MDGYRTAGIRKSRGSRSPSLQAWSEEFMARQAHQSHIQQQLEQRKQIIASLQAAQEEAFRELQTQWLNAPLASSLTTVPEVLACLEARGCANLTKQLDESSCSRYPVSSGGFGDVYRGSLLSGTQIAIKMLKLYADAEEGNQRCLKYAARELYTWSKCQHRNVQRLLGVVEFREHIGMVSLWETNGDLTSYVHQIPQTKDRHNMCIQIARGLSYLHEQGMIHGDLKASNILISEDGTPLLSDFGNAKLNEYSLQFTDSSSRTTISVRWTAPEILDGRATYSTAADVYSLGMTILETLTGKVPWYGIAETAVMVAVLIKKQHPKRPIDRLPLDPVYADHLWTLMERCWTFELQDRPDAAQVLMVLQDVWSFSDMSS